MVEQIQRRKNMASLILFSVIALAMNAGYSYSRVLVCIPVVLMAFISFYSDPYLEGWTYYLINASFCAIVVALLQIVKQTSLSLHIQIINAVAIFAHGLGFIIYLTGQPPTIYNDIILVLGVIEFTRLMLITKMDYREYGLIGGFNSIYRFVHFRKLGGHR